MTTETMDFNADVSRLLDIVINALYTNQDVFLRELISNAADACDRLRYEAIARPKLIEDNAAFRIHIYKDTDQRRLTVVDNGIGMSRAELIDHLGTIAKSGTARLMEKMAKAKDKQDRLQLIGQFGVGFYASYMVADHVRVISRKAGGKAVNVWQSDGKKGFDVRPADQEEERLLDGERGTAIVLDLKDSASEFLIDEKIKQTVQQYSDHIDVKIFLNKPDETNEGEGWPINNASALWARPRNEITKEQYTEFYKHISHGFDEPLLTVHWRAEGKFEYTGLLFVPTMRPWDLYDPSRRTAVRLYVKRVFISDQVEGLMYPWLRFVRGIIDSADLPLNISRQSLQYNPLIAKIRSGVTKKILSELDKLSRDDPPAFIAFWGQFGAALKEGLYDAAEHREDILKVCRFYSTHENAEQLVSLNDYVERMPENQQSIYYISGPDLENLKNSPQIEGFKAKKIEVLFFTDTIDDFWLQQVSDYKGKTFKSVTKGDISLDDESREENNRQQENWSPLLQKLSEILADEVSGVKASKRLTESPVCLVAAEDGVDMHMEQVLKLHQKFAGGQKPVLEINENHPLIQKLAAIPADDPSLDDAALLLLDQAKIIQGMSLKDPAGFARRMSMFMEKSFAA